MKTKVADCEPRVKAFLDGVRPFELWAGAVLACSELGAEVQSLIEADAQCSYLVDGDDLRYFDSLTSAMNSGQFDSRTRFVDQICPVEKGRLDRLLRQVRRCAARQVVCSVFVSRPESARFDTHVDSWDGLVVQVVGKKRWTFTDSDQSVVVHAGDVLLVRVGVPHHAAAVDDTSVHIRIAMLDAAATAAMLGKSTASRPVGSST